MDHVSCGKVVHVTVASIRQHFKKHLFLNAPELDMKLTENLTSRTNLFFLPSRCPFLPVAQSYLIPFHVIINLTLVHKSKNKSKSASNQNYIQPMTIEIALTDQRQILRKKIENRLIEAAYFKSYHPLPMYL